MGRLRELRRGRRWRQQNYHGADTGAEEGAELEAAKVAWVDTGAEEGVEVVAAKVSWCCYGS